MLSSGLNAPASQLPKVVVFKNPRQRDVRVCLFLWVWRLGWAIWNGCLFSLDCRRIKEQWSCLNAGDRTGWQKGKLEMRIAETLPYSLLEWVFVKVVFLFPLLCLCLCGYMYTLFHVCEQVHECACMWTSKVEVRASLDGSSVLFNERESISRNHHLSVRLVSCSADPLSPPVTWITGRLPCRSGIYVGSKNLISWPRASIASTLSTKLSS